MELKKRFIVKGQSKKVFELVEEMTNLGCVKGRLFNGKKSTGTPFLFKNDHIEYI